MGAIRKIELALSDAVAAELDDAVARGEYPNAGEIVREAIEAWTYRRQGQDEANTQRLKRLWEEGLASGPAIEGNFDLDDIKRRTAARRDAA